MCSGIATYLSCMIIQQGCIGYYVKTERLGLVQLGFFGRCARSTDTLSWLHPAFAICSYMRALQCVQHLTMSCWCNLYSTPYKFCPVIVIDLENFFLYNSSCERSPVKYSKILRKRSFWKVPICTRVQVGHKHIIFNNRHWKHFRVNMVFWLLWAVFIVQNADLMWCSKQTNNSKATTDSLRLWLPVLT